MWQIVTVDFFQFSYKVIEELSNYSRSVCFIFPLLEYLERYHLPFAFLDTARPVWIIATGNLSLIFHGNLCSNLKRYKHRERRKHREREIVAGKVVLQISTYHVSRSPWKLAIRLLPGTEKKKIARLNGSLGLLAEYQLSGTSSGASRDRKVAPTEFNRFAKLFLVFFFFFFFFLLSHPPREIAQPPFCRPETSLLIVAKTRCDGCERV